MNRVRKLAAVALVAALAGGTAACDLDSILDVDRPGVLTTDELAGPAAIPLTINGIIGDFTEAMDNYTRYSGLFNDEFILAGTFPTRHEVDQRRILADNATVTGELYEPIHTSVFSADVAAEAFREAIANPPEGADVNRIRQGLAYAEYFGAYARVLLAELYCESPIQIGPYESPNVRMAEALALFESAEETAAAIGGSEFTTLENAAIVGQARAHMWLGDHGDAAADAQRVDDGAAFFSEYSGNAPQTRNEVSDLTWGHFTVVRWTIGDGSHGGDRRNEAWPYFDEWVSLDLILPDYQGAEAFDTQIDVLNVPLIYENIGSPILLASEREARLYQAEAILRGEAAGDANAIVNGLRADWGLGPITLTGGALANWADEMAREYAREMWLNGHRQATLRRFATEGATGTTDFRAAPTASGVNLYPPTRPEDTEATYGGVPAPQICFPTPRQELDNNPNPSNFGA